MGVGQLRLDFQGLLEISDRLNGPPLDKLNHAEIVPDQGVARLNRQPFLIPFDRIVELLHVLIDPPEVIADFGIVRSDFEGLAELGDALVGIS